MILTANSAYFLALASAVLFSGASVIFARFSVSHSALWMNYIKNSVAGAAFLVVALLSLGFFGESLASLRPSSAALFLASGAVGMALGDFFLFKGYQRLGSARTLMVFSFSPLFLAIEGYVFFGQDLHGRHVLAILLMMACVWTISFEKFREHGAWEWRGIVYALAGVLLDNVGNVLTRWAFDLSPGTGSFTANALRCASAVLLLFLWQRARGEQGFRRLGRMRWQDRSLVVFSALFGCFLSLACWLTALKVGHIGSLAAVGSFNPISASLWEWLLLRKRPTLYLIAALALFLGGFFLLLSAT
jgi:drug/metabolite transporter (DMT)-like permease